MILGVVELASWCCNTEFLSNAVDQGWSTESSGRPVLPSFAFLPGFSLTKDKLAKEVSAKSELDLHQKIATEDVLFS